MAGGHVTEHREHCPVRGVALVRLGVQTEDTAMTKMEAGREEATHFFSLPIFHPPEHGVWSMRLPTHHPKWLL